jgi:hypothetical protein
MDQQSMPDFAGAKTTSSAAIDVAQVRASDVVDAQ